MPAEQLLLALDGRATHAYAVSFIVTNIPTSGSVGFDGVDDVEAWFRRRTDIEDCVREAKLDAALCRLPSGAPPSTRCGCGRRCWPGTCYLTVRLPSRAQPCRCRSRCETDCVTSALEVIGSRL